MAYRYRGIPTFKCPFDLALYMDVIHTLRPATVLEFGSNAGGSALWLADMLQIMGLSETHVYSCDINVVTGMTDPRISFLHCDVGNAAAYLSQDFMNSLPHPILVIEDSSHKYSDVLAILEFLHEYTRAGDYLIVEDGIISIMGMEEQYGGGPYQGSAEFLRRHPDQYRVDRARCDHFGRNVTWNIDGYIERVG